MMPRKYRPASPKAVVKARTPKGAPVTPELQVPVARMASPEQVQTTSVSQNTSTAPQSPCRAGWIVSAEPWIRGEVPLPASLE